MARVLIGGLIVAAVAVVIGYMLATHYQAMNAAQAVKIDELQREGSRLNDENARLKQALAKVQSEEDRLAEENQQLSKALAQAQLTGKVPTLKLPYPPK
jgi:septal ring factor EnvC (AmiA/AmiB activator)